MGGSNFSLLTALRLWLLYNCIFRNIQVSVREEVNAHVVHQETAKTRLGSFFIPLSFNGNSLYDVSKPYIYPVLHSGCSCRVSSHQYSNVVDSSIVYYLGAGALISIYQWQTQYCTVNPAVNSAENSYVSCCFHFKHESIVPSSFPWPLCWAWLLALDCLASWDLSPSNSLRLSLSLLLFTSISLSLWSGFFAAQDSWPGRSFSVSNFSLTPCSECCTVWLMKVGFKNNYHCSYYTYCYDQTNCVSTMKYDFLCKVVPYAKLTLLSVPQQEQRAEQIWAVGYTKQWKCWLNTLQIT